MGAFYCKKPMGDVGEIAGPPASFVSIGKSAVREHSGQEETEEKRRPQTAFLLLKKVTASHFFGVLMAGLEPARLVSRGF